MKLPPDGTINEALTALLKPTLVMSMVEGLKMSVELTLPVSVSRPSVLSVIFRAAVPLIGSALAEFRLRSPATLKTTLPKLLAGWGN